MPASPATFFFHFGEIGTLVPIWFGIVVVGDGVEARSFGDTAGDDAIRHTNDGGGVPATTELGEDRAIGTESSLDGFREDGAEVLFIFGVGAVTDFLPGIKIPILADDVLSGSKEHERRWRDSMDANIRC